MKPAKSPDGPIKMRMISPRTESNGEPGLSGILAEVEERGFAIVAQLLSEEHQAALRELFESLDCRAGRRDGLRMESVQQVASSAPVLSLARGVLGEGAFPVKATLFGKSSSVNWLVPWHQDVMIPVANLGHGPGFGAWSVKAEIPHACPHDSVLESMVAIRLHLDGSTLTNGPLRVLPGTHRLGRLSADRIQSLVSAAEPEACLVSKGGALLMRPLLLHASAKAESDEPRRVVHIEFAAGPLPGAQDWYPW